MRALTTQEKILIGEVLLLFLIPLLPKSLLELTDNILVRIVLLLAVLASSLAGPYVLLLTFIVVLAIFGIRNHMKINEIIPDTIQKLAELNTQDIEPLVVVDQPMEQILSQNKPNTISYDYSPQNNTGDDTFTPVDDTINEKVVLPTLNPDGKGGNLFPNPPDQI
jgi:predicted membrane protein